MEGVCTAANKCIIVLMYCVAEFMELKAFTLEKQMAQI